MPQRTLEERVKALERQVARLMTTAAQVTPARDWRQAVGMFSGNEAMKAIAAAEEAQDDITEIGDDDNVFEIRQQTWKLMADVNDYHPACARLMEGLFEGLAAGCGRHISVSMRPAAGDGPPFVWSIG